MMLTIDGLKTGGHRGLEGSFAIQDEQTSMTNEDDEGAGSKDKSMKPIE